MSGDVQPRKRKDKKKKKDELAAEELRGTAAAFGEGDVLMHSQHEHGTGGHWCAKVIFFSLLAVLIGLIGLIILENRGLTELEANSVETQYTGILDGWIEDAPDDHHDEHTLELKHPDEEEHDEAEASDDGEQEVELEDIEHEPEDEATPVQSDELEDGDASPERTDDDEGDDAEQSDEEPAYAGTDDDNNDDDEEDFLQHDDDDDNDNNSEVDNDDEDIGDNDDREEEEHDNVSAAVSAEAPYEEVEESAEQLPADSLLEEEEYSRQQERQRQEEAAASHLWLKLSVGAALLLATHAVVRRATRAEDSAEGETPEVDGDPPPVPDRRMTLLPDELLHAEVKKSVAFEAPKPKPVVREPSPLPPQRFAPVTRAAPAAPVTPLEPEDSEPEEPEEEAEEEVVAQKPALESRATPDLELYSEDDEEDPLPTRGPKPEAPTEAEPAEESDDEVADDVEIIEDEQLDDEDPEEELGEEEEISDVDDGELLSRLEAKYGRLPEPERYERPPLKDDGGAKSLGSEDEWAEEPSELHWRRELDLAEEELHRGSARAALARTGAPQLRDAPRALWLAARALDALAEQRRDNALLGRAADGYLRLLRRPELLSDARLLSVAERVIDRLRFKGDALAAAPAHRALASRFPHRVEYRNQLVISYLMANQVDLAREELEEILKLWPEDRVALAHYGFVLKTAGRLEEAVGYLRRALAAAGGDSDQPRFHYHLGDALLLLGRRREAHEAHELAAGRGHFKSAAQRSLYNVERLTARPWWDAEATYAALARALAASWREIRAEGEAARALYAEEAEGLRERGRWTQLDLFARGREVGGGCARAPATCRAVLAEPAAARCRRGQVKFSLLTPGTHVRPHAGPTNCRLRMHLGLANTDGAYLRVHNETRQWREGGVLLFDDSFEHEVWHNGTGERLVLIVDVWHPELTARERRELPAI